MYKQKTKRVYISESDSKRLSDLQNKIYHIRDEVMSKMKVISLLLDEAEKIIIDPELENRLMKATYLINDNIRNERDGK